jgi:hypothetical protein
MFIIMSRSHKPIVIILALLFFALSFNAYACLFPISGMASTSMENGCPDTQERPTRQICDGFKSLGIQAPPTSNPVPFEISALDFLADTSLFFNDTVDRAHWLSPSTDALRRQTFSETIVLRI